MLLTLKKGRDIPHLSFSHVKWRLRKTHSLPCPTPSPRICLGIQVRLVGKRPSPVLPEGKNPPLSEPWSLVWGRLTFGDVL